MHQVIDQKVLAENTILSTIRFMMYVFIFDDEE